MNSLLYVLFSMVINIALLLIFIRFIIQFAGFDKKNPYVVPAYNLTAVVDVFEKIFPSINQRRISTASLVLLLLLVFAKIAGQAVLMQKHMTAFGLFFSGMIVGVLQFLDALRWVIMASILSSFVLMLAKNAHPVFEIIMRLADPLLEPFRKISPNLGMIDLSPLIAMLALSLLSKVIEIIAQNIHMMM